MDFSDIIGALVLGILAGFIARALLPGKQKMSFVMTIVLGLAGAFVGSLIFTEIFGIGDEDKFDLGGLLGAIIGAMLLLFLYERFVAGKPGASPAADRGAGERDRAPKARHGGRERRR